MTNFTGTLAVDTVGVGLAAAGLLNPLLAAFIHVASEMAFILNSARLVPSLSGKYRRERCGRPRLEIYDDGSVANQKDQACRRAGLRRLLLRTCREGTSRGPGSVAQRRVAEAWSVEIDSTDHCRMH